MCSCLLEKSGNMTGVEKMWKDFRESLGGGGGGGLGRALDLQEL